MAFTHETFSVIVQPIGGTGIRFASYQTDDDISLTAAADYFTNVERFGVRVFDLIFVLPITTGEPYILNIDSIDADGTATASLNAGDAGLPRAALNYIRRNASNTAYEARTVDEVLTDIGIPATASTFIQRNAGNTAYEAKTPAQVLTEIGIPATASTYVKRNAGNTAYEAKTVGEVLSDLSIFASLRSDMAAVDTAKTTAVLLKEAGREGQFFFDASDLSASVTIDTAQGDFVAPASDTDGSSGAWKRVRPVGNYFKTSEFGDDINVALAVAAHRGGGVVEVNKLGSIVPADGLYVPASVELVGLGEGKTIIKPAFANIGDFYVPALAHGDGWAIYTGPTAALTELPSFTAIGAEETSITFGSAHGLVEGDEVLILKEADGSFTAYNDAYRQGERNRVVAVDGNKVYLLTGALVTYTYSATAPVVKAYKVPVRKGRLAGFTLDLSDCTSSGAWGGIKVFRQDGGEVSDISVLAAKYTGIDIDQCFSLRAKRIKSETAIDHAFASADHDYGIVFENSTDVVVSDGEARANWSATDFGGWDIVGASHNYRCGYERMTITADYMEAATTTPAAGMHGNTQDCFYRDCRIDGGATLSGLNSFIEGGEVRIRRAVNPILVYAGEIKGGVHEIRNVRLRSEKDAGAASKAAIFVVVQTDATSAVEFRHIGGSLEASSETRPYYIEGLSTSAPISYEINGVAVTVPSCDTSGLVRVVKTGAFSTPAYARQINIMGFSVSQPWADWDGGYVATDMVMPRQDGEWNDTSSAAANIDNAGITLPHAYPTGYPVAAAAYQQSYALGYKIVAGIRSISVSSVRPFVASGDGTNITGSVAFTVHWSTW